MKAKFSKKWCDEHQNQCPHWTHFHPHRDPRSMVCLCPWRRRHGPLPHDGRQAALELRERYRLQWEGKRVALVGCCAKKADVDFCPAQNLYLSPLFKKARAWAEHHCDGWAIVSAGHGLIDPRQWVYPYDWTLSRWDRNMRAAWASRCRSRADHLFPGAHFIGLAGEEYLAGFPEAERPLKGLGIGERLAWLSLEPQSSSDGQLGLFEEVAA